MSHKKILHIDDDLDDCLFFQEALAEVSDVEYSFENNPVMALKKLFNDELLPNLIFLDINMPLMDGTEVLKELNGHPRCKNIPIIIFSTCSTLLQKNCNLVNVLEKFQKPADFEILKKMMKDISDKYCKARPVK